MTLTGPGIRHLYEGSGRLLIDQVAEDLDAVVDPRLMELNLVGA